MNELTAMLVQSTAQQHVDVVVAALAGKDHGTLTMALVATQLLQRAFGDTAALEGSEAAMRRWLALQLDVTTAILRRSAPPRRSTDASC